MRERRTSDLARAAAVAHRVLGLGRAATVQDTQRAYRRCASVTHPDHHGGDPRAAAEFRAVRSAADVLTDLQRSRAPAQYQLRALLDLPLPGPDPRVATAYCPATPVRTTVDLTL